MKQPQPLLRMPKSIRPSICLTWIGGRHVARPEKTFHAVISLGTHDEVHGTGIRLMDQYAARPYLVETLRYL